nr:S8 family serine peptidase [Pleionea sp. CnH1-48]
MHRWGNQITETTGLFQLLFSFNSEDYQNQHREAFDQAYEVVEAFRIDINQEIQKVHPGYDLKHGLLKLKNTGKGITVAVFDLFEADLLEQQRQHYSQATIETVQNFGDPVKLNHGNSVIDVILSIAPEVTIVPVSAESSTYNDAMLYIKERTDVQIMNMSRAFAEKDGALDPEFEALLKDILKTTIVTKSLGNTGTDLDEVVTPYRASLGLPPVNTFSYDLKLIKQFLLSNQLEKSHQHLLLAANLNPFADQIALTATIPGNNALAVGRTLSVPAEAVYSWTTGNFESGSSFAAPQMAALSALLWQVHNKRYWYLPKKQRHAKALNRISNNLTITARASELGAFNTGKGLPNANVAYLKILFPWWDSSMKETTLKFVVE